MVKHMRVTQKGQVMIPRKIREVLGITPETDVEFVEENGKFYLVKASEPNPTGKFEGLEALRRLRCLPTKS
jgi:antitoxin PrlF